LQYNGPRSAGEHHQSETQKLIPFQAIRVRREQKEDAHFSFNCRKRTTKDNKRAKQLAIVVHLSVSQSRKYDLGLK